MVEALNWVSYIRILKTTTNCSTTWSVHGAVQKTAHCNQSGLWPFSCRSLTNCHDNRTYSCLFLAALWEMARVWVHALLYVIFPPLPLNCLLSTVLCTRSLCNCMRKTRWSCCVMVPSGCQFLGGCQWIFFKKRLMTASIFPYTYVSLILEVQKSMKRLFNVRK